jgi:hypothetical protein
MKHFVSLLLLIATGSANAAATETWHFVYVSRSSDLGVTTGQGDLARRGSRLSGKLIGEQDVHFLVDIRIKGAKASAFLGAVESDDGGTRMQGTYRQRTMSVPGGSNCWQTFQLSDGFSSIALARNAPRCEP